MARRMTTKEKEMEEARENNAKWATMLADTLITLSIEEMQETSEYALCKLTDKGSYSPLMSDELMKVVKGIIRVTKEKLPEFKEKVKKPKKEAVDWVWDDGRVTGSQTCNGTPAEPVLSLINGSANG
jgi:hypothetical protein